MNFYKDVAPTVETEDGDKVSINSIAVNSKSLPTVVNKGSKNLLNITVPSSSIFTVNSDGTVLANGSGFKSIDLTVNNIRSYPFDVVLSGCPKGGDYSSKYALYIADANGNLIDVGGGRGSEDHGDGVVIPANTQFKYIRIIVRSGYTASNLLFKPMICTLDEYNISPDFVQYVPDNATLDSNIKTNGSSISQLTTMVTDLLTNGPLNRFKLDSKNIQNGYTMTLKQTGLNSFYLSGTCSLSSSNVWSLPIGTITLPPGTWRMNGSISGGQNNLYFVCGEDSTWRTNSPTSTSAAIKTITSTETFTIYAHIQGQYTVNQELKLIICDNDEYNLVNAIQPYAMSNGDLTSGLAELIDTGAKNLLNYKRGNLVVPTGVSYVINDDNSITVTWNTSSTVAFRFNGLHRIDGKMILTGCPVGGGTGTYLMQIRQGDTTISGTSDTGTGSPEFELPSGTFDLVFRLAAGSFTRTFYPMLCRKLAYDISTKYVPYSISVLDQREYLVPIWSQKTVSTGATLADTGVGIDIPMGPRIYQLTATLTFTATSPQEIEVRASYGTATQQYVLARKTNDTNSGLHYMQLTCSCIVRASTTQVIHIKAYAKSASTGNNGVTLIARKVVQVE